MASILLQKTGRFLQRLALWLFGLALLAFGLSWYFQDQIITQLVASANRYLQTPVHPQKITFSLIEDFPRATIVLHEVTVEESLPGEPQPLLQAGKIYCGLNLTSLLSGELHVDRFEIADAQIHLRKLANGQVNYRIIKTDVAPDSAASLRFSIRELVLKRVAFTYQDQLKNYAIAQEIQALEASLQGEGAALQGELQGNWHMQYLSLGSEQFLTQKPVIAAISFAYQTDSLRLRLQSAELTVANAPFSLSGELDLRGPAQLDLKLQGRQTSMRTLTSLLPERLRKSLSAYQSQGEVYFEGTMTGRVDRRTNPRIDISFGCQNASLYHPDYDKRLEQLSLTGHFSNGDQRSVSSSSLTLQNIRGTLEGQQLSAALQVKNFREYPIALELETTQELNTVLELFPQPSIQAAQGKIGISLQLKGKWRPRGQKKPALSASGQISLQKLNLALVKSPVIFTDLEGDFLFNDQDLAITSFTGKAGSSDFELSGLFKNIINYLASPDQPIKIEARLRSGHLHMEELLRSSATVAEADAETSYRFDIAPHLQLSLDCQIDRVDFDRFRGTNLQGHLEVGQSQARLENVRLGVAGGTLLLNTQIDGRPTDELHLKTQATVQGLAIDSIFYVFHNFNQHWLEAKHLKGRVTADIGLQYSLNKDLRLQKEQLKGSIAFGIKDGQLNDFEPMQKLSTYVDAGALRRLRFSELNNEVQISDQTVYLPGMEVSSNVSTIRIAGTHTFDQHIDYQVKVPLNNRAQADPDAAFGAIRDDGTGKAHLLLRIAGTIDDYKVLIDKEAVGAHMREGLRKEREELRQIFKNKGQAQDTLGLEDNEYFEWDDDGS